jgi:hypothetical protein
MRASSNMSSKVSRAQALPAAIDDLPGQGIMAKRAEWQAFTCGFATQPDS